MKKVLSLLLLIFVCLSVGLAQTLDQYSGVVGASSPNGGTGYFRVEKNNNRWFFVDPVGNYFWMRSAQSVNWSDGGTTEQNAVINKYGSTGFPWGNQTNKRLTALGFNTIGEYASTYVIPDGMYGASSGSSVPHPYIRLIKPSAYAGDVRAPYHVKDIVYGMNKHYTGYRGHLPDVFDPAYQQCVTDMVNDDHNTLGLDASHYLIGTTSDDLDELFGFGNGPNSLNTSWRHPEIGYMVAITAPTQGHNQANNITYTDAVVHTKQVWMGFLAKKYGPIANLNTAWGSNYVDYNGVLNEDGSDSWIGTDSFALSNTNPNVAADMRRFTELFAEQYFSLVAGAIRTHSPHHLVFSPDAIGAGARREILHAASKYVDVVQVTGWSANPNGFLQKAATALGDKPMFAYMLTTACADSPYSASCSQFGSITDYLTQPARGTAHAQFTNSLFNFKTTSGVNPVIGYDMWEWTDKISGGEHAPFGLVTVLDNVYDGKQAVVAAGTDPWGFTTGGEARNYGDFATAVTTMNKQIDSSILRLFSAAPPVVTPSVVITAPLKNQTVTPTFTVKATFKSGGTPKYMKLWIDGHDTYHVNKSTTLSYTLKTALKTGKHRLTVQAVSTTGKLYSGTIYVTV